MSLQTPTWNWPRHTVSLRPRAFYAVGTLCGWIRTPSPRATQRIVCNRAFPSLCSSVCPGSSPAVSLVTGRNIVCPRALILLGQHPLPDLSYGPSRSPRSPRGLAARALHPAVSRWAPTIGDANLTGSIVPSPNLIRPHCTRCEDNPRHRQPTTIDVPAVPARALYMCNI
ncbi:hypothetical protein PYCCODRAFT_350433 [Trametes coccinea BRFM310]|uniref:Uncharacterized protein n=1 Tax=Trametes coccinea (strain BRFM310) TaxID=1353009 RepID=A0A1Y2J4G3_TRAC3|nr:hypothetical protein PYCCODRAFT_350433 [Trametes coccinea BRFM310]